MTSTISMAGKDYRGRLCAFKSRKRHSNELGSFELLVFLQLVGIFNSPKTKTFSVNNFPNVSRGWRY